MLFRSYPSLLIKLIKNVGVRREEVIKLRNNGYEAVLSKTRWIWLKRKNKLSKLQKLTLKDLMQYNMKIVKSYLLKEDFNNLKIFQPI